MVYSLKWDLVYLNTKRALSLFRNLLTDLFTKGLDEDRKTSENAALRGFITCCHRNDKS